MALSRKQTDRVAEEKRRGMLAAGGVSARRADDEAEQIRLKGLLRRNAERAGRRD